MSASQPGDIPTIRVKPNPAFFWAHHENSWSVYVVDGKSVLLPEFKPKARVAGCGNMRVKPEGAPDSHQYQHALAGDSAAGWTWMDPTDPIPSEFCPPGTDGSEGYVATYDCLHPKTGTRGVYHTLIWDQPRRTAPGSPTRWGMHWESYNRWRLWLVETGVITQPPEYVHADRIALAETHRKRAINLTGLGDKARDERIEQAEKALEIAKTAVVPGDEEASEPAGLTSASATTDRRSSLVATIEALEDTLADEVTVPIRVELGLKATTSPSRKSISLKKLESWRKALQSAEKSDG